MIGKYRLRQPCYAAQWIDGDHKGQIEIIEFIRERSEKDFPVDWHHTSSGIVYLAQHNALTGESVDFTLAPNDHILLFANGEIAVLTGDTFVEIFEFVEMAYDPEQLTLT